MSCFSLFKHRSKACKCPHDTSSFQSDDVRMHHFIQPTLAICPAKPSLEKSPLSSSVYYDSANPPPFAASGHVAHTCCSFVRDEHRPPVYTASAPASPLSHAMKSIATTIQDEIHTLDATLRDLSLKMHDHPEIMWQEHKTHDLFVDFFSKKQGEGWKVTPHAYGLETAWEAKFEYKASKDSRTIGFQSELDALPGIGHACGHNLIAISGVAAALSVAKALQVHDVPGTVILLGTPAEEGGGGKLKLLKAGAYDTMDSCLMVHPAPQSGTGTMLAVQPVVVEYKGKTAHAGAAPWEGVNALDAAVLAYQNISVLRQQMPPSHRVHGIIQGDNWAPNVIPGSSRLIYNIRAPTISELKAFVVKVGKCFEAAALATGCEVKINWQPAYADVHNTPLLSSCYADILKKTYDLDVPDEPFSASTDAGNCTYHLPTMHAEYEIHLQDEKTMGNHTIGFTHAARSKEAHERTLEASVGIALVGARVLVESEFRDQVWNQWKEWRKDADGPDE